MGLFLEKWFLRPRPIDKPQLRLFCFSYAGGGAALFCKWADELPPQVELCAIQLPGREDRFSEKALVRFDVLFDVLVHVLEPVTETPFIMFGHSLGALIGFELARYFYQTKNIQPKHLFLSARRAPHIPQTETPISHLSDREFALALRNRYEGIPQEIWTDQELLALFLPLMRADMQVLETYQWRPGNLLPCPISVFGGAADRHTSHADLNAWKQLTTGSFSSRIFPGDHFFIRTARSQIVQAITQDLKYG